MREHSKILNKYKEVVHKHQQANGIGWAVELELERQTKLDEWREYYIYEHRKRGALEKELDRAKRELEPAKERMREVKRNGSVGVPEIAFLGRWAELIEYKERISQAQKEVEMAQKRWEVLSVEGLLSTIERNMLTEQAEEELKSAQKRLEAEKSDELDQLNREAARAHAQAVLASAHGRVSYANTRLEQLDTLLEWITGQFAEIATEHASSSWGSKHERDLLEGWGKYYVYMRERLRAKQDRDADQPQWCAEIGWTRREKTEAEETRDDLQFPQERVRPLEALLAWIEREFPQIAAQNAPSTQDSQSKGDHQQQDQDQTVLPYSKPSSNGPARKACPLGVVGKSTRRKGKSAREWSQLSQAQPLKVSKPGQRRRHPLNRKRSTTRDGVWPPEGRVDGVGQIEEQVPPKVAVRRSERTSQRTCMLEGAMAK